MGAAGLDLINTGAAVLLPPECVLSVPCSAPCSMHSGGEVGVEVVEEAGGGAETPPRPFP